MRGGGADPTVAIALGMSREKMHGSIARNSMLSSVSVPTLATSCAEEGASASRTHPARGGGEILVAALRSCPYPCAAIY